MDEGIVDSTGLCVYSGHHSDDPRKSKGTRFLPLGDRVTGPVTNCVTPPSSRVVHRRLT